MATVYLAQDVRHAPRRPRGRSRAVNEPMFVIELTYKAPLIKIDAHMAAHVAFLRKYYAAGNFLVSGRQNPRVGGIILKRIG